MIGNFGNVISSPVRIQIYKNRRPRSRLEQAHIYIYQNAVDLCDEHAHIYQCKIYSVLVFDVPRDLENHMVTHDSI